jgi:hypothetical protein
MLVFFWVADRETAKMTEQVDEIKLEALAGKVVGDVAAAMSLFMARGL